MICYSKRYHKKFSKVIRSLMSVVNLLTVYCLLIGIIEEKKHADVEDRVQPRQGNKSISRHTTVNSLFHHRPLFHLVLPFTPYSVTCFLCLLQSREKLQCLDISKVRRSYQSHEAMASFCEMRDQHCQQGVLLFS